MGKKKVPQYKIPQYLDQMPSRWNNIPSSTGKVIKTLGKKLSKGKKPRKVKTRGNPFNILG